MDDDGDPYVVICSVLLMGTMLDSFEFGKDLITL